MLATLFLNINIVLDQQVIQHSGNSTIAVQSYSNQSVVSSHPAGNSLDLVGLLREPTPEPVLPPEPIKLETIIKTEEPEEDDEAADIDIQVCDT